MNRIKNINNIISIFLSIITIAWYILVPKFLNLICINYWIRIAIIFLFPILFTFFSVFLRHNQSKDPKNKIESGTGILSDILIILAIAINIFIIAYNISEKFFPIITDYVLIAIILLTVMSIFLVTIKKLLNTTYWSVIFVCSIIILLGWFNSQELSLIAIFSVVLNTIVSIDDRTRLISFLKKKGLGNEFIWKQNVKGELTDEELKGKFIAQKIIIYIIIALMYIVMKVTENNNCFLYIYSIIENEELNSYSQLIIYLYRGADRITITTLVIVFLFINKKIRHMLKEIFQPQCQITTEHIQKSSKDAKKKENKKKDTKKRR